MRWVTAAPFLLMTLLLSSFSGCRSNVSSQELAEEYFNLGNAFFELGRYQDSFDYYSRAVRLSDDIPAAGYNLARLHQQRGEYTEALEVLDDLLTHDPSNGLYRETRAFVLFQDGQHDLARELYATLIDEYPARVRLNYNLGLLELEAGNEESAYEALVEKVEMADEDADYRWILAEAAYESGREEEALNHLEVFRGLSADSPDELARLAERQAEWGFYLSALEIVEEIPETIERDPDLLFMRGAVELQATDDFDRAVDSFAAAVRRGYDPKQEEFTELLDTLSEEERQIIENRVQSILEELDPAAANSDSAPAESVVPEEE